MPIIPASCTLILYLYQSGKNLRCQRDSTVNVSFAFHMAHPDSVLRVIKFPELIRSDSWVQIQKNALRTIKCGSKNCLNMGLER